MNYLPFIRFISLFLSASLLGACASAPPVPTGHPRLPAGHPEVSGDGMTAREGGAYAAYIQGAMLAAEGRRAEAILSMKAALLMDPGAVPVMEDLMELYLAEKMTDKAMEIAGRILDIREDNAAAHAVMGRILLDRNQYGEAVTHLERSLELDPGSANLIFLLAQAYEKSGQTERGIELLSGLEADDDHSAMVSYYLSRLFINAGDMDAAVAALLKAIDRNPAFLTAVSELGYIYEQKGDTEGAVALYLRFLEERDVPEVREVLARLFLKEDRLAEARVQLEAIFKIEPDNTGALLMAGLLETKEGNNDKALELFGKVRRENPENYEVVMQVGVLLRQVERYDEAIETFRDASRLAPDRYEPYVSLAMIYDTQGRQELAVTNLETAIALEPTRVNLTNYLAQIHLRENRTDQAISVLDAGLERVPDEPSLLYQLGIAWDRKGKFARTEKIMLRILEVAPEHYDAMNYLGYSWAERDIKLQEALKMVMRALEIKPDAPYIADSLGWVYYRMGRYEEALAKIREAAEKMKDDATVLEHLGDVYNKLGDQESAVEYWRRALKADPGLSRVEEKIRRSGAAAP